MLSIRPLMPADVAQVLKINVEAQPNVAALDRVELARLAEVSSTHIVAADGNAVCGYALNFGRDDAYDGEEFLTLRSLIAQPFVYIDQVAVAGPVRTRGIGRRLYEALERTASDRGISRLCCEVNTRPPNPGSLAFHAKLGFSTRSSLATRDGRNVVLLEKRIIGGTLT
jgi:uncharacterized protein